MNLDSKELEVMTASEPEDDSTWPVPTFDSIRENWRNLYDGIFTLEEDVLAVLKDRKPKSEEEQEYLHNLARLLNKIIRVIESEED